MTRRNLRRKTYSVGRSVSGLLLLCAISVASCSYLSGRPQEGYSTPARFKYQDEVGFAKATVISVARWEDVQGNLVPNLTLTANDALNNVALTALTESEASSRLTTAALTASLTPPFGGAAPAASPAASAATSPLAAVTPLAVPSLQAPSIGATPVPIDSAMKYELAASLYQEVQLLNLYVQNAAQEADDVPFLVTMDVSLFPSTPAAAVNAFVLVSFAAIDNHTQMQWVPEVIPVILSDDVETKVHARETERAVSLAATLAGTAQGVSGQADLRDALHTVSVINGIDSNNLQLVGSAGKGALIIRFGASYSPTYQYALTPQTRRIHCLVLINRKDLNQMTLLMRSKQRRLSEQQEDIQLYTLSNTHFQYVDLPQKASFFSRRQRSSDDIPPRPSNCKFNKNLDQAKMDTAVQFSDPQRDCSLWQSLTAQPVGAVANTSNFSDLWQYYSGRDVDDFTKDVASQHYVGAVMWAEMAKLSLNSAWNNSLVPLPLSAEAPPGGTFVGFRHLGKSLDPTRSMPTEIVSIRLPVTHLSSSPSCWSLNLPPDEVKVVPDSIDVAATTYQFNFENLASTRLARDLVRRGGPAELAYDSGQCPLAGDRSAPSYRIRVVEVMTPTPTPTPTAKATPTPTLTPTPTPSPAAAASH